MAADQMWHRALGGKPTSGCFEPGACSRSGLDWTGLDWEFRWVDGWSRRGGHGTTAHGLDRTAAHVWSRAERAAVFLLFLAGSVHPGRFSTQLSLAVTATALDSLFLLSLLP